MDIAKRMPNFLDRFTDPFRKKQSVSDDEVIAAFLERVALTPEESVALNSTPPEKKKEEGIRIFLRRMKIRIKDLEISDEDIIRSYPAPIKAILLQRFVEKEHDKKSVKLAEKINDAGFKLVQNDVWVLPPIKTPQNLSTDQDLKVWVYENLTKKIYRSIQFVLPFVAIVDMKQMIGIRRGILRKYTGNTIFNVMELDEIVPPSHIYNYLKKKNLGLEDVVRRGDIIFLANAINDEQMALELKEKRQKVREKLSKAIQKQEYGLEDILNLSEPLLTEVLQGVVAHPDGVAQRIITEGKYWERFLTSEVPKRGSPAELSKSTP